MPYLFAHFREKLTPDGEQVYFSVSRDGYNWSELNGGKPVITCSKGEMGCRDIEIVRLRQGGFVVIATDLCIVNRMDENYHVDWKHVNSHGSSCLSLWRSDDLIHFSPQELIDFSGNDFGCMWAPEVFYDAENDEYLVHWGSTVGSDGYTHMSIYCSTTKDFISFSKPKLFFTKDNEILDSHIVKGEKYYHLFYKNSDSPACNMHAVSDSLYGEYRNDDNFEKYMLSFGNAGSYEAPTTYQLPDGRWCLMIDFFGCEKEKMGYVPFVSDDLDNADFVRSSEKFTFPYGFKHGGVIEITDSEYEKLMESLG